MTDGKRGNKLAILLALFLVVLVLVLAGQRVVQRMQPVPVRQAPPLAVEVISLKAEPFTLNRRYTGSLVALQTVELSARISSRVKIIHHREGDRVKKGDLLVTLDDTEQRNQIKRLQASERRLRAEYVYWKNQYQRSIKLLKEKVIADSVYEEAKRMKDSLQASLEENTEALAAARQELDYTRIRAPLDARIQKVSTAEGDLTLKYVRTLMELVSTDAMKAVVTLPQADLGRIRPGLPVQLRVPALNLSRQSEIRKLYPVLDAGTRNATFEAGFPEPGDAEIPHLYAGMMVDATVVVARYEAALVIPHQALIETRNGSGVFILVDGKARWRSVQPAEVAAGRVRISDGLRAGEMLILTPDQRLKDGMPVHPVVRETGSLP